MALARLTIDDADDGGSDDLLHKVIPCLGDMILSSLYVLSPLICTGQSGRAQYNANLASTPTKEVQA